MICCDIWHKYHEWYFEIVIPNFETILKYHKWYLYHILRTNHAIICLYYYTELHKLPHSLIHLLIPES